MGGRVPGQRQAVSCRSIALWVTDISLFLQLPSSGPGDLQLVPCRDPGTEGVAILQH